MSTFLCCCELIVVYGDFSLKRVLFILVLFFSLLKIKLGRFAFLLRAHRLAAYVFFALYECFIKPAKHRNRGIEQYI